MRTNKTFLNLIKPAFENIKEEFEDQEHIYSVDLSEVETESRNGFWAWTNGGFTLTGHTALDMCQDTSMQMRQDSPIAEKLQELTEQALKDCQFSWLLEDENDKESLEAEEYYEFEREWLEGWALSFYVECLLYAPDNNCPGATNKGKWSLLIRSGLNTDEYGRSKGAKDIYTNEVFLTSNPDLQLEFNKAIEAVGLCVTIGGGIL